MEKHRSLEAAAVNYILVVIYSILVVSSRAAQQEDLPERLQMKCKPLAPKENVELNCIFKNETKDCKSNQGIGTLAVFQCKPYYIPYESSAGSHINEILCGDGGNWIERSKFNQFACREDCGKRLANPKPQIVHGKPTNRTSWPWHATLFRQSEAGEWHFICGGSIIRSNVILTAAHCVDIGKRKINETLYKIVVGAISSNFTENEANAVDFDKLQIFNVKRIMFSTNYDPVRDFQGDIALIQLDGLIVYSDYIRPVCLPTDYALDHNALRSGQLGDVVGFGFDETGNISHISKHIEITVLCTDECTKNLKITLSEAQFCAGIRIGDNKFATVCSGDSGGGFVKLAPVHDKYYIHGIVSLGDPRVKDCQNYAIFTRVSHSISWIRDTLEQIHGEVIRELALNYTYPYILRGEIHPTTGEVKRKRFDGIPKDWVNRMDSIELTDVTFYMDVLLESLSFARTISSINLTNVQLLDFEEDAITFPMERKWQGNRLYMPYLKTFIFNCNNCPKKSFILDEEYFKWFLFFEITPGDKTWKLADISTLGINIHLQIGPARLLIVNKDKKRVLASNIKNVNNLLANIPANFQLESLALRYCTISTQMFHSLSLKFNGTLKQLIINRFYIEENETVEIFRKKFNLTNFNVLEELVISLTNIKLVKFSLTSLPKCIKRIEIGKGVELTFTSFTPNNSNRSSVLFPQLESFGCSAFTRIDENLVHNLNLVFGNLKEIRMSSSNCENMNFSSIKDLSMLENVYVRSNDLVEYTQPTINNPDISYFLKDDVVVTFPGLELNTNFDNILSNHYMTKLIKSLVHDPNTGQYNIKWKLDDTDLISQTFPDQFTFVNDGRCEFYTSYYEYKSNSCLSANEVTAIHTGIFKFNGTNHDNQKFVSGLLGTMWDRSLKEIYIYNSVITQFPTIYPINLEKFLLINVELFGGFEEKVVMPKLKEYRLYRKNAPLINHKVNLETLIPFKEFEKRVGHLRDRILDYNKEIYTHSNVNLIDIVINNCRIFYMDKNSGYLSIRYLRIESNILPYNFTSNSTYILKRLTLDNTNLIIDESIKLPSTLQSLNLDTHDFKNETILTNLLNNLPQLLELRIQNCELVGKWREPIPIPLQVITSLRNLRYLNLHKVNLTAISNEQTQQKQLTNLTQFSCTYCIFTEEFVTNVESRFPSVKYVRLVAWYEPVQVQATAKLLKTMLQSTTNHIRLIYLWILLNEKDCEEFNQIFLEIGIRTANCTEYRKLYSFLLRRQKDNNNVNVKPRRWVQIDNDFSEFEYKFLKYTWFENDMYDSADGCLN